MASQNDDDVAFLQHKNSTDTNIEKLLASLNQIDLIIGSKLEGLETLDVTIQIVNYKIHEATEAFKLDINNMKDERNRILASIENRSELSLILNDLDQKIAELEKELTEKIKNLNHEKIELQKQCELIIFQLDEDVTHMQNQINEILDEFRLKNDQLFLAQMLALQEKYDPMIDQLKNNLKIFQKLQSNGWKVEQSEHKLTEILEDQGLKLSPSGRLETYDGALITFQEAQEQGYFQDVTVSLDRIFRYFHEREGKIGDQMDGDASARKSQESSDFKGASPDIKYLKQHLGKPLTLALSEITVKQPIDPIHYLGHFLFKYRYNQEMEDFEKAQVEELSRERKRIAEERWKQFVADESRNAVIDMVLRAEQIAYDNQLKYLEELRLAEEIEEEENDEIEKELIEEARDKFE